MRNLKLVFSKKKYILIACVLIVVVFILGYFIVSDLRQQKILRQEFNNLINSDLLSDKIIVEIKTKGNYSDVENKIKNYFKKISDNYNVISNYLLDENLINILSAKNIEEDAPKFEKSYKILKDTKENIDEAIKNINYLCDRNTVENLIDKEKERGAIYKIYKESILTDKQLNIFSNIKNEGQILSNKLIGFIDRVDVIIKLLEDDADYWYIDDEHLYFDSNKLLKKYNELTDELNNFVEKEFNDYVSKSIKYDEE